MSTHDATGHALRDIVPPSSSRLIVRKARIVPRFCETDMMGVIHNAEFIRWFEEGRLSIMLEVMPLEEALAADLFFMVIENTCKYKHCVRFGDSLILTTSHRICTAYEGKLPFNHSLVNEKTKVEVAEGSSTLTMVDKTTFRFVKEPPPSILERYWKMK